MEYLVIFHSFVCSSSASCPTRSHTIYQPLHLRVILFHSFYFHRITISFFPSDCGRQMQYANPPFPSAYQNELCLGPGPGVYVGTLHEIFRFGLLCHRLYLQHRWHHSCRSRSSQVEPILFQNTDNDVKISLDRGLSLC